jgi:hypothetical protein
VRRKCWAAAMVNRGIVTWSDLTACRLCGAAFLSLAFYCADLFVLLEADVFSTNLPGRL